MFSIFNRKKIVHFPFDRLKTDMHSHLVPGVDDGSPDVETSISLIRGMQELGYQKLVTTPHIMGDLYKNNPEILGTHFQPLQLEMKKLGMAIPFSFAAEYLMDDIFEEKMQRAEPLLPFSTSRVLVEISFVTAPLRLMEQLFDMQMKGYQPVLAHVERYLYFHRNRKQYEQLKNSGVLFQANILSFSGYYGKAVQEAAEWLAQNDFYNFLGTDLHHERHLEQLRQISASSILLQLADSPFVLNREI